MMTIFMRTRVATALAVVVCLWVVGSALGQIPRQNLFAQKYHFTLYEMEQFSERLRLSAEQREIFSELFSEMQERVMEAERPLREAEAESGAFSDEVFRNEDSEWRQTPERFNEAIMKMTEQRERIDALQVEWVAMQERLAAELFADLRLLLDREQIERLDGAQRWRHRARLLRWSELPYANLTVSSIARSMELRPDPSRFGGAELSMLDEIYDEYERELDRLLLERAAVEREHAGIARGMGGSLRPVSMFAEDPAAVAWQEAVGAVNARLVAMQKKYIGRIASLAEPERGVAFHERCREEAYPFVLGRTAGQNMLAAMLDDERLSAAQRERVSRMLVSYTSERDAINNRWVRLIENLVAKGEPHILASSTPLFVGDQRALIEGDRTFFEMSGERKAVDERWMGRVRDLRAEFGLDAPEEEAGDD